MPPTDDAIGGEAGGETDAEKRERVMRRLAEMLRGPSPQTGGAGGAVAGGGMEEAIASLGLELSDDDTNRIAGAVREGPDPEEAAALFQAMLESFRDWKRGERP